jgi:hypothetical protein
MNKIYALLILALVILTGYLWNKVSVLEQEIAAQSVPGLYESMTQMQLITHKLAYAIDYENEALVDFYIHELEELTEDIIESGMIYHGYPVAELTESMLEPAIERLEEAVEVSDWNGIKNQFRVLVNSCNSCHAATDYPHIIITERSEINPFNQRFEP